MNWYSSYFYCFQGDRDPHPDRFKLSIWTDSPESALALADDLIVKRSLGQLPVNLMELNDNSEYKDWLKVEARMSANGNFGNARAQNVLQLATPKQLWMIRLKARDLHLDADQECLTLLGCKLEEISKRAASRLIDELDRKAVVNDG